MDMDPIAYAEALVEAEQRKSDAYLEMLKKNAMSEIIVLPLALDTAVLESAPFKVGFPFQSFYVVSATDTITNVNMKMDTNDNYQGHIPLYLKDSASWPTQHRSAYLFWDAQVGKTISIVFLVSGIFKPGSNISQVSSSVDGNLITNVTPVSVTSTATLLLAQDLNRKVCTVYNDGTVKVYLGASGVTAANGIPLLPGSFAKIKNTYGIYGITDLSACSVRIQTES